MKNGQRMYERIRAEIDRCRKFGINRKTLIAGLIDIIEDELDRDERDRLAIAQEKAIEAELEGSFKQAMEDE